MTRTFDYSKMNKKRRTPEDKANVLDYEKINPKPVYNEDKAPVLDYSKINKPVSNPSEAPTLDYSKIKKESPWKSTLEERRSAKNLAYLQDKKDGLVKAEGEGDMKPKAFGTDIEKAKADLAAYERKMPRMIEGINNSSKRAPEKKKKLAYLDRMHKYFQKGVEYASAIHDVKNDPTPPSPFFSADNAKLKKDGIISFNIPAGHTCPGKGECFGFCYAMQGPQSWPAAMKKRVQNWGLAERPDFVNLVNEELKKWGTGSKKKMGDIVRIHDSGDFYSQDYIDKWHDIAKANPNKKFYAYTKALDKDWKKLHNLPNFTVIQSVGSKHDHLIDPSLPHSYIFPSEDALKSAGYVDTHESDLPAANSKNHPKVGLVIHGIWSKGLGDDFGKEFKGDVDTSATGEQPIEKKEASMGLAKSARVSYVPDVSKFDQIDQLSQLEHSPHLRDKILVRHAKTNGHGYHASKNDMFAPLNKNALAPQKDARSHIDEAKKKFFGNTNNSLQKADSKLTSIKGGKKEETQAPQTRNEKIQAALDKQGKGGSPYANPRDRPNQITPEITSEKESSPEDFGARLNRIHANLQKINKIFADKKARSKEVSNDPAPETKPHLKLMKAMKAKRDALAKNSGLAAAAASIRDNTSQGQALTGGEGPSLSGAIDTVKGWFGGSNTSDSMSNSLTQAKTSASAGSSLQKDDKSHAPKSPEDEAHDVVEEGESIQQATKTLESKHKIKAFFSHLKTLKSNSDLRSADNQAYGSDKIEKSGSKWKPFMSDGD